MELRDAFGGKTMVSLQCNAYDSEHKLVKNDGKKKEAQRKRMLNSMHVMTTATTTAETSGGVGGVTEYSQSTFRNNPSSPTHPHSDSSRHTHTKVIDKPALTYYLEGVFTCWSQTENRPVKQIACPKGVQDEDNCLSDFVFIKAFA